jgi:hypothetical protein
MTSHFHLDNKTLVNSHENIQSNTTKVNSEILQTNYLKINNTAPPPPPPPHPQISLDTKVQNNQNNGATQQQSSNFDSDTKSNFLGALKEWAVVCEAIESGDQILLFRKGGIMEFRNGFELKFKDFFLFPTFEHQARESIHPKYHAVLDQIEKNNDVNETKKTTAGNNPPPATTEYTKVTSFVEITHFGAVSNLDRLKALEDFHIWTDDYVKTRFNYNPKKPLYLLLLRAYKLKKPIKILNKPQWIGCKSWIQIDSHDPDLDMYFENHTPENPFEYLKSISNPCIDDDNFNKMSEKVRSII